MTKNLLVLFMLLATIASCSKSDENRLIFSEENISFDVDGGEYAISVSTNGKWDCNYDVDWLLVRSQQDKIKIIADSNPTEDSRSATINILCNGHPSSTITVNQVGISLDISKNIDILALGGIQHLPISCNTKYKVESTVDWVEAKPEADGLLIQIARNYNLTDRVGNILLSSGSVTKTVTVNQSSCQWYESFQMAEITGGSFYIGSQKDSQSSLNYDIDAYQIESPVHSVTLSDYCIGVYEVTQSQWTAAMGNNPSNHQGNNLPVENVSWEQVQEFIALLKQKSGLPYRLPTEAEWEYASKGGNKSEGYKYSGYSVLGACGWYYSNSESSTHEVGIKYPNELGIYDMSGNVREWCNDWFEYYSSSSVTNPQGPSDGYMKVNRGGSWTTPAVNCRNSYRHTDYPSEASQDLGFRIALSCE